MDLNAWVDVLFFGRRKSSHSHGYLMPLKNFFILIPVNIKVLLIHYTKFQPNIPICSGENDDFISFAFLVTAAILNSGPG